MLARPGSTRFASIVSLIDGTVTCYLADVSGHGIAAGVLMSMVKSAVRTAASQGVTLVELMQRLNTVLMDLKAPSMYATLAFLRFVGSDHLEYSLAGHPPVLHYHCSTHSVSPLKMEQLPIALFGTANFESRTIAIEPGDLLVTVSDGLLDVANRQGQEFGWEQIERLVLENAAEPLSFIVEKVIDEAARFGVQEDDRSLLLVRVPPREQPLHS